MKEIKMFSNPHLKFLVRLSKYDGEQCIQTFLDLKSAQTYIAENKEFIQTATIYELTGFCSDLITSF